MEYKTKLAVSTATSASQANKDKFFFHTRVFNFRDDLPPHESCLFMYHRDVSSKMHSQGGGPYFSSKVIRMRHESASETFILRIAALLKLKRFYQVSVLYWNLATDSNTPIFSTMRDSLILLREKFARFFSTVSVSVHSPSPSSAGELRKIISSPSSLEIIVGPRIR
jgi:hypothetical protein